MICNIVVLHDLKPKLSSDVSGTGLLRKSGIRLCQKLFDNKPGDKRYGLQISF
jgi:hypothetical protein